MANTGNEQTNGRPTWLRQIGHLRDGFLVGAGALYLLGYLVWTGYAARYGLGLLPALEPQYLLAGLIPALVLCLVYFGFCHFPQFKEELWKNKDTTGPGKRKKIGFKLFGALLIISIFFDMVLTNLVLSDAIQDELSLTRMRFFGYALVGIVWFLFMPGWKIPTKKSSMNLLLPWRWRKPKKATHKNISRMRLWLYRLGQWLHRLAYSYLLLIVGGTLVIFLYGYAIDVIPQEVGGFRARCAYVDIDKDRVSQETVGQIMSEETLQEFTKTENTNDGHTKKSSFSTVRSIELEVIFSGGSFMLVRKPPPKTPPWDLFVWLRELFDSSNTPKDVEQNEEPKDLYQLKNDFIRTITWCQGPPFFQPWIREPIDWLMRGLTQQKD